ncbi:AbgT family transporter [Pandoraea apista]|uniref:Aminobenzoyl-glutamate transporter n=1 Tax=Pandoraea apista TaxID=93218 RepID=A0A5E5P3P5_9BURK|nr:AbgT family transporter [Pandoraea apista]OXS89075.1 aminobenzoyl-glutamate transporter [Pandoraea apista]VVG70905.1 aminobenzoyl-glutamate transporter [Pandoraea apista]
MPDATPNSAKAPGTARPHAKTRLRGALGLVEWLGNALPHPVTLFALMTMTVVVLSSISAWIGISAADPRPANAGDVMRVTNLLTGTELVRWASTVTTNFTSYAPLGTVLVALLGISIAEHSGLLSSALRALVVAAPRRCITMAIVFAAVISNVASDLGYVVVLPLAAMLFATMGRHPLAGLSAAFAGVSGGYGANLLLSTSDPLLGGITQGAAQLLAPEYSVSAVANWYFMAASSVLVILAATWVTERVIEPRLGAWHPQDGDPEALSPDTHTHRPIASAERRALWAALGCMLVFGVGLFAIAWPDASPLRDANGEYGSRAPLFASVVAFIVIFFALPGLVYGAMTGTYRNDRDVIAAMSKTLGSLGQYLVLVFFASQFVALFGRSGLGTILAIKGAGWLGGVAENGPLLFIGLILLCAAVNLMISSGMAQWALMAPIVVPMMMLLGYAPEVVQAAYRIGDSVSNIVTPMLSYFALILAVATRYQRDAGVGTLLALMLPYAIVFTIAWTAFFCLWVFGLELPVGPNAQLRYTTP